MCDVSCVLYHNIVLYQGIPWLYVVRRCSTSKMREALIFHGLGKLGVVALQDVLDEARHNVDTDSDASAQ